jgi:hypothetical protein
MQTGSSGTLIGWKSGQTSMGLNGGSVASDSANSPAHHAAYTAYVAYPTHQHYGPRRALTTAHHIRTFR